MIRHNIPGARKRRVRRDGPNLRTGWVRSGDRWSHPDGRTWDRRGDSYWESADGYLWKYDPEWRTGAGHPARFEELLPF